MSTRHRERSYVTIQGHMRNRAGTVFNDPASIVSGYETCDDVVLSSDCDAFHVERWNAQGLVINKRYQSTSSSATEFVNWTADVYKTPNVFDHLPVSGLSSELAVAATAAAKTSPSRPYVDVPVSILELGDVYRLVRDAGRGIIFKATELTSTNRSRRHVNNVARTNLLYHFGIAPVVGDLFKLRNFQRVVKDRIEEIKRLQGPRGLRRTIPLGKAFATTTAQISCQSVLVNLLANWRGNTLVDRTGHVRWEPEKIANHLDPGEMRVLAENAVLGFTNGITRGDLSTLWEAIPWSWLIDWGSNVGDYLKTHRNIIPARLRGVWIHTHTLTDWSTAEWNFDPSNGGVMTAGRFVRETKHRSPSVPIVPTAHFPFLDGKQAGILASLSVTRQR